MIYIGLDISTQNTGVAILDKDKKTLLTKNIKITPRIRREYNLLNDYDVYEYIIKTFFHCFKGEEKDDGYTIDDEQYLVFIEDTFCNTRNLSTSKKLIGLGACFRYHLNELDIDYYDVPPCSLKKNVTGKGNSKKGEVKETIEGIFQHQYKDDTIADAVSLCYYGFTLLYPVDLSKGGKIEHHHMEWTI